MRDPITVVHPKGGKKLVKQSEAAASDINSIMSKYVQTGTFWTMQNRPTYGDFTTINDFHDAMNRVIEAKEQFEKLPIGVKKHCNQDPGEFVEMCFDPERQAELVKLGLVLEDVPEAAPSVAEPSVEAKPENPPE